MQRIIEEAVTKTIIDENDTEQTITLYTMRYTYDATMETVEGEEVEKLTLAKTERIDSEGIWELREDNGSISQTLTSPAVGYVAPAMQPPADEVLGELIGTLVDKGVIY